MSKILLDKFYISTNVNKNHKFSYDKLDKKRPSWIKVNNLPKGTNWIKIIKDGEAFWYRIYFENYFFPVKNYPWDYEHFYDEIASKYDSFVPQNLEIGKKIISIIKRYNLPKSIPILDLCAGTGIISEVLAQNGYSNITLVDISSKELAIAKNKSDLKNCKFIKADITKFIPKNKYGLIINSMGIDYFDETAMKDIFSMISNSLSSKGLFISVNLHEHPEYTIYLKKLESKAFMLNTQDVGRYRYEYFVGKKK